jgi:hypothetical protein
MGSPLHDLNSDLTIFWSTVAREMESQVRLDIFDEACPHLLFERPAGPFSCGEAFVECRRDHFAFLHLACLTDFEDMQVELAVEDVARGWGCYSRVH